jgi:plasmid stabilization system protein ParE
MESPKEKVVVFSKQYAFDTETIFDYGVETFGNAQANIYEQNIDRLTKQLSTNYLMCPECKPLATKDRIYRNIILDSHLIVYRITSTQIEVLRAMHSHSSISKIKTVRRVKL